MARQYSCGNKGRVWFGRGQGLSDYGYAFKDNTPIDGHPSGNEIVVSRTASHLSILNVVAAIAYTI